MKYNEASQTSEDFARELTKAVSDAFPQEAGVEGDAVSPVSPGLSVKEQLARSMLKSIAEIHGIEPG